MSLRDYFAGQAISGGWVIGLEHDVDWQERSAWAAYSLADAMLEARETNSDDKHTQGG